MSRTIWRRSVNRRENVSLRSLLNACLVNSAQPHLVVQNTSRSPMACHHCLRMIWIKSCTILTTKRISTSRSNTTRLLLSIGQSECKNRSRCEKRSPRSYCKVCSRLKLVSLPSLLILITRWMLIKRLNLFCRRYQANAKRKVALV
jgi:hypothetical protein